MKTIRTRGFVAGAGLALVVALWASPAARTAQAPAADQVRGH